MSRAVLAALLALALPAYASDATRSASARADLTDVGTALPVVVLQAGLQDGKRAWRGIVPTLARSHRVVAFDRPGHGDVRAVDGPRDPCTVADEQHRLLRAANVPPPYVLVGHSLGGLYEYVYAKRHPEDVAGLVLLDPTHPQHWEKMQTAAPGMARIVKTLRLTFDATDRREFDDQARCLDTLDLATPLAVPVRLLFSGKREAMESGAFAEMLVSLRADWVAKTGAPRAEVLADSSHYVQNDRPDAVAAAIDEVAAHARLP